MLEQNKYFITTSDILETDKKVIFFFSLFCDILKCGVVHFFCNLQMDDSIGLSYAAVVKKSVRAKNVAQISTGLAKDKTTNEKPAMKSWIDQVEEFENDQLVSDDCNEYNPIVRVFLLVNCFHSYCI